MIFFKLKDMKFGEKLEKVEKDFLFETFQKIEFFRHLRENETKEVQI